MEDPVQIGTVLAGKYRVERIIGRGGMGFVMAARHLALGQLVAIKFMRSAAMAFDDGVQRFLREAKAVASLRSENIARVMDVGYLEDGSLYMVMEYLEGATLASIVSRRGPLAVEDAVDFVLQVCAGITEAHELGIVHRDLKPANLFLTRRPSGVPLVKVLDFGISKYRPRGGADAVETNSHGVMGSPPFMSPEQTRSAKYTDQRSDIWSLGIILYYLLSGELPFLAETAIDIFWHILKDPAPSLCKRVPWVPPGLETVIHRCLEKNPDDRWAKATQLAAALTPYASANVRALVGAAHIRISGTIQPLADSDILSAVVVEGPEPLDLAEFLERAGQSKAQVMPDTTSEEAMGFEATCVPDEDSHDVTLVPPGLGQPLDLMFPDHHDTEFVDPLGSAGTPTRRRRLFMALVALALVAVGWAAFANQLFDAPGTSDSTSDVAKPALPATPEPALRTPADPGDHAGARIIDMAAPSNAGDTTAARPDAATRPDDAASDDPETVEVSATTEKTDPEPPASSADPVKAEGARKKAGKRFRATKNRTSHKRKNQDAGKSEDTTKKPPVTDPFGKID